MSLYLKSELQASSAVVTLNVNFNSNQHNNREHFSLEFLTSQFH